MALSRKDNLESLSKIISDYRQGEVNPRTPELIDAWLEQFPNSLQEPILEALTEILPKTYISRDVFKEFLEALAINKKISPGTPSEDYWKQVNLLSIQQGGNSQTDILSIFDEVLQETHGFSLTDTGSEEGDYIYLDDCVGTGSRVRSDICSWLETDTPNKMKLHIITPILYQGSWWIDRKIEETAKANKKTLTIKKWRLDDFEMENRRGYRNTSDVLWPTEIPDISAVQAYAKWLEGKGYPVTLRQQLEKFTSKIFKNEEQRNLLEQAFLTRGCQIRQECTSLPDHARPLGYHNLDCFGFGSMFITYRNCPNNCPLALWVQQAEYPALFPRKTNTQTANEKFFKKFFS